MKGSRLRAWFAGAGLAVVLGSVVGATPGSGAAAGSLPPDRSLSTGGRVTLHGSWTVRALVGSDGRSALPADHAGKVTLTFDDGRVSGSTGCNSLGGPFHREGENGLVISGRRLVTTLVGCLDEPPLTALLPEVRSVSGSGDVRYLEAADGTVVVEMERAGATGQ